MLHFPARDTYLCQPYSTERVLRFWVGFESDAIDVLSEVSGYGF